MTKKNENSLSKTDMVTIDDLKLINPVYDRRYVVSVTDVAKANRLIEDIERNLHTGVPQVGDLVCGSYYRGSQTFERGIIVQSMPTGTRKATCSISTLTMRRK